MVQGIPADPKLAQLRRERISVTMKGRPAHNKGVKRSAFIQPCVSCGEDFESIPSAHRKYCSQQCVGVLHSKRLRGKINPNLNTAEVRQKMAESKKGKPSPTKGIPRPYMRKNSNKARERAEAMGRVEYKSWRNAIFKRDNYTCQICDEYGGILHADHIKPWAQYEELRYELSNGRTLCVPCHYYITFKRKMPVGKIWCNYKLTRKRG